MDENIKLSWEAQRQALEEKEFSKQMKIKSSFNPKKFNVYGVLKPLEKLREKFEKNKGG